MLFLIWILEDDKDDDLEEEINKHLVGALNSSNEAQELESEEKEEVEEREEKAEVAEDSDLAEKLGDGTEKQETAQEETAEEKSVEAESAEEESAEEESVEEDEAPKKSGGFFSFFKKEEVKMLLNVLLNFYIS